MLFMLSRRDFLIGGGAFAAGGGLTALVLGRKDTRTSTPVKKEATQRKEFTPPETELYEAYNRFLDKYGQHITQALVDSGKKNDDYRLSSDKPDFRVDRKYLRDIRTVVGRIDFDNDAYMVKQLMDSKGSFNYNDKWYSKDKFAKIATKNADVNRLKTNQQNLFVNRWHVPLFLDPEMLVYERDDKPDFAKINESDPLENAKIYRTRTGQEAVLVQVGNLEYWAPLRFFDTKPIKARR